MALLNFQNCSDVEFSGSSPSVGKVDIIDDGSKNFKLSYTQPSGGVSHKLDILFVLDTSSSLDEEMTQIVNSLQSLVSQLPEGLDFQIGVLLGHTNSTWVGKLFKANSEPLILKSTSLTTLQIQTHLETKLKNLVEESASDGGEAGLFSLNKLLQPNELATAKEVGFFRSGAALSIVFVADENDICAEYPDGVTPVPDPNGKEASAKELYCSGITPLGTVQKLLGLQLGRPLLITGLIYRTPNESPQTGENEVGYGYLETILISGSEAVALSDNANIMSEGLKKIGDMVKQKVTLKNEFLLSRQGGSTCAGKIMESSIDVKVDGKGVDFLFSSITCMLTIPFDLAGDEKSLIEIRFSIE